jgi:hypothetical protein
MKIETENPHATWNYTHYVDQDTGEITRKAICKTNQLILF